MQATNSGARFKALQTHRTDVREKLARAWEKCEPLILIRKIEQDLQGIWDELDAIELTTTDKFQQQPQNPD